MPRQTPRQLLPVPLAVMMLVACGGDSLLGDDNAPAPLEDPAPRLDDRGGDGDEHEPVGCTYRPTGGFDPTLECRWDDPLAKDAYPEFDDVVSTPTVVNMTDDDNDGDVDLDDIPDIAFIAYPRQDDGCPDIIGAEGEHCGWNGTGILRVVSGSCDASGVLDQHFAVGPLEIAQQTGDLPGGPYRDVWLDNSSSPAVGDIDNDGSVDIVAVIRGGGVVAFERDGSLKWINLEHPTGADFLEAGQISIANVVKAQAPQLDVAEIVVGRVVLDGSDGSRVWGGTAGIGTNAFLGPVSAVSDVDLDGTLNILAGDTVYTAQHDDIPDTGVDARWVYNNPITDATCDATGFACDGFTAVGNFDSDEEGEIVIVRAGVLYIRNHDGSPLLVAGEPVEIPIPSLPAGDPQECDKPNEGGPPTIADFDGDGQPEIATAGAEFYIVADLECFAKPRPAHCDSRGILWKVRNHDCSSRVTGSSVFDFEGDGAAEVIYNDEQVYRIFDGSDGTIRLEGTNTSHTRLEMPIVVDVDNDGNAEIVFIETPQGNDAPVDAPSGIRVWGDRNDSWVTTRRVWNQHSYHVTNVGELGEIPVDESVNWLTETPNTVSGVLNNFRQNLPESDVFVAPDLTISLVIDDLECGLVAEVCNIGDANVAPGSPVTFTDEKGDALPCADEAQATTTTLSPGDCEIVKCGLAIIDGSSLEAHACVDNSGPDCSDPHPDGSNNECDETNNTATASGALECFVVE